MAAAGLDSAADPPAQRVKRPEPGERNVLITSALPYVNNVPHLGNIIGCVLSADVYARYCRSRGYNCIYICGTDEYGTATETKALEEKLTCQEICDKYHAIHADIYRWFNISFDKFGRTPTQQQTDISQSIFKTLLGQRLLEERETEQLYSVGLEKFLADRYVVGTCPKCGYEDARGDQCDNCTNMLNPTELINPRCKITGTKPELRKTKHFFLDLPALTPQLQDYITRTSDQGGWSSNCVQVTKAWMRDGLKHRCITRDLKWGVQVPVDGFEGKVFYVWFDAPIGYISITANYTDDWQAWWQNPDDVELVQFMGKDNVPFHTVIFPATLLGTGQKWTLMHSISVTEYLNYEGTQFSKSRGTGVFGNDAKETGIPVDVWRYYLLATRPEQQDTDFKWVDLQARNNGELLANLGNFINRVLKFTDSKFDGRVPAATAESGQEAVAALGQRVAPIVDAYLNAMEARKLRDGIRLAMDVSREGNAFIQHQQLWELVKTDKERCGVYMAACAGLVLLLAAMVEPYIPTIAAVIQSQLGISPADAQLSSRLVSLASTPHRILSEGHRIGDPQPLLSIISDELIAELRQRFAGSQADRAAAQANGTAGKAGKAAAAKGAKKSSGGGKAAKVPEGPVDVSRLDLRVGQITKVWRHPDADSLYVEEVEIGEEAPRQVVSGLVKFIPEEEMLGARAVIVANMKPANMRGIKSHAMVLCASTADGTKVEFVQPPEGAAVGDRVTAEGFPGEPDEVLAPKKKVFETVQPDLKTNDDLVACYKGVPLATAAGVCRVKSVAGCSIK